MAISDIFKRKKVQKRRVMPIVPRSYVAAGVNRLFADFGVSDSSADGELRTSLPIMRARSRELSRNNSYVKRYLGLLTKNVVGKKGITYQSKALNSDGTIDTGGNDLVESAFRSWGRLGNCTVDGKMTFCDVQKMAVECEARDGEVFILKHFGSQFRDGVALQFIDADRVDHDVNRRLENGNEIRMGVELDAFKKPVRYHVLQDHPGDAGFQAKAGQKKYIQVPAERMIHIFKAERPGQTRGVPRTAPTMSAIKQLDGFKEAAIVAARVGASKMGFFTSNSGDDFNADEYDGQTPVMNAESGTFTQLPAGMDFKSFDPGYPTGEFDPFHKAVLKSIASGLEIGYTSLANDAEATSYSSIRQVALDDRDFYSDQQEFFIEHLVRPIFECWLEYYLSFGNSPMPLSRFEKFANAAEFRGRSWSWVDPLKEMNAAVTGLHSGIQSLQHVAAQYGMDAEELLSQIKKDKELMVQFGVDYALEPYNVPKAPEVVPDEDEDDAEDKSNADNSEDELNRAIITALTVV
jgi:lambda family phage portal protein